eukprot:3633477-Alexandrium_andersonii.AAC.1
MCASCAIAPTIYPKAPSGMCGGGNPECCTVRRTPSAQHARTRRSAEAPEELRRPPRRSMNPGVEVRAAN